MTQRRVRIDGRMLEGEGTGVATYARTLVEVVARTGREVGIVRANRPSGPLLRTARALRPGAVMLSAEGADLIGPDLFRIAHRRFDLTGRMLRLRAPGPPGIMHWTYPLPLAIEGWANLYTVHDVIPLVRPDLSPIDPRRHARVLHAVVREAARIVTVSAAARDAILSVLDVPAARVVDVGQAVVPPEAVAPLPDGLGARGYLLFCGRIEPRKNLLRLLAGYAASGVALPLLLAGPVAEGGGAVLDALRRTPGARHMGFVDRTVLATLIAQARAVVMPSLLEGFGLPVAEAMACGTPTLVSRDPALREVSGGAALEIDATHAGEIGEAIARVCSDKTLWQQLSARGRERANIFSVDAAAARLDPVYAAVD